MTDYPSTHHGSRERVSWSVEVTYDPAGGTSITGFGEREEEARADYARRAKALHRGKTIRLVRMTQAEAWVMHHDAVAILAKSPQEVTV